MLSLIILSLFCAAYGEKLPPFTKPCGFSDPNLNQCIIKHANEAWPSLLKGSKKYKILKLSPLQLPSIDFNAGNIKIHFDDFVFQGMENMKIVEANWDRNSKHVKLLANVGDTVATGKYAIDGRILVLPIVGNGNAKFTHYGANLTYEFDYDIVEKGGEKFLKLKNQEADVTATRAMYYFDNLFNGDKRLTDQMNNFLTENWREFYDEMRPTFRKAIVEVLGSVMDHLSDIVPFDELFLK